MGEKVKVTAKKSEAKRDSTISRTRKKEGFKPVDSPADHILQLQRTIGNQAVQRLFKSGTLQAKLKIGQPNDIYEQEADRVADIVMQMPEPKVLRQTEEEEEELVQTKPIAEQITPLVQRQAEPEEEEEEEPIQTKPLDAQVRPLVQRQIEEEEEPIQAKLLSTVYPMLQRQAEPEEEEEEMVQPKPLSEQIALLMQRQVVKEVGEAETSETRVEPAVIHIIIQRQNETNLSTTSTLTIEGQTFYTLELPDRDNRSTGNWRTAGRIPAGTYNAHVRTGGGRGWRIQLENVERTGTAPIQIHTGNVPRNTTGCILVGTSSGENRVNNSINAMTQIRQIVQNAGAAGTRIQVTVNDPAIESEEAEESVTSPKALTNNIPAISSDLEYRIQSLKGGGQPLPKSTRAFFEPRFGHDFSQVLVHTNSQAAKTAQAINAKAFTTGRDVVFGAGQYSPETTSGSRLLAHELTHVVQQNNSYLKVNNSLKFLIQRQVFSPFATTTSQAGGHGGIIRRGQQKLRDRAINPISKKERIENLKFIQEAIKNSRKVIELYDQFLNGKITFEEVKQKTITIGNAWEGITKEGRKTPQIVQDAIEEVEEFEFGEEGRQMWELLKASFGDDKSFQRVHIEIEKKRQQHFIDVLKRKANEVMGANLNT